ncbi:hypothetical protein GCM10022247_50530 [Allokutzneria multivorans]|uniref:Uncharacterized protein n=1 Tax=Allokutzneria multivorans TaxID=1142134 RepID=A0ABP7T386_9PSEU
MLVLKTGELRRLPDVWAGLAVFCCGGLISFDTEVIVAEKIMRRAERPEGESAVQRRALGAIPRTRLKAALKAKPSA